MQVVPVKASPSFLKGQIVWVFLADKSIESSLFIAGSAGRSQALQVHVSEKLPRGESCLHSDRHHTSRYWSFQPSLYTSYKAIFSFILFLLSFVLASAQNTPSLRKNCFHLAWNCVACVDSLFTTYKNLCHSFNWCSYRSKPMWDTKEDIFYSLHAALSHAIKSVWATKLQKLFLILKLLKNYINLF